MLNEIPKITNTGGRSSINWDELYTRWLTQNSYNTVKAFLMSYGIDPETRRVKIAVKDWPTAESKPAPVAAAEIASNVLDPNFEPSKYEEKVKRVWTMIRSWRAVQAEEDYRVGNKLRALVEGQINKLQEVVVNGGDIKTYELMNLAKCLETIQRVQRLSLGMSTDNVGVEDARKLAEEQAGNEESKNEAPVFAVEVNKNGKFERLRPRRVK